MRPPKNLQTKFSQLGILMDSLNDLDQNHHVSEGDKPILEGVIRKAEIIMRQLTSDKNMPKYDQDTIRYLNSTKLILMEVKADLEQNWRF